MPVERLLVLAAAGADQSALSSKRAAIHRLIRYRRFRSTRWARHRSQRASNDSSASTGCPPPPHKRLLDRTDWWLRNFDSEKFFLGKERQAVQKPANFLGPMNTILWA